MPKKSAAGGKAVRSQLLEMSHRCNSDCHSSVGLCVPIAGAAQPMPTKLVLLGAVPWSFETDGSLPLAITYRIQEILLYHGN